VAATVEWPLPAASCNYEVGAVARRCSASVYSKGAQMADDRRERGIDLLSPVWHLLGLTPHGRGDWYLSLNY